MSRHKTKADEDVESSLSEDDCHHSEQTEEDADVEETESGTDSGTGEETQSEEEEGGESEQDDTDSEESDENDPFDQLINSARSQVQDEIEKGTLTNEDEDAVNKRFQKVFREKYRDAILWVRELRQNPTHRKIMETAQELRSDTTDYDYEESIEAAISQRKHLLNRLVPEYNEDEMDTD